MDEERSLNTVFDMPVHPAAAVFPMLSPDELAELAADIKANGLAHPIVVKDGVLIDGRNRREACRIAKVEPATTELPDIDVVAYILSTNINRRHMTRGQRAMTVAKLSPETQQGKKRTSSVSEEVSGVYLSQARAILKWAPELADAVLAGAESLDRAYAVAIERKTKAEVPEKRLQVLRATDPELADRVVEQQITLDEADALKKSKLEKARIARQGTYDCMEQIEKMMFMFREGSNLDELVQVCTKHSDESGAAKIGPSLDKWIAVLTHARKALPDAIGGADKGKAILPDPSNNPGQARDEAARKVGVSGRSPFEADGPVAHSFRAKE